MQAQTATFWIATSLTLLAMTSGVAVAAINIPFTINLSENVTVTGTPRIAVDVGGKPRYATYTSGTGTNSLTFTLSPTIGDVDMDGVTLSPSIELNGGTIKDSAGNDATLTFTPPNTSGIKVNYPSLSMDFTNGTSGRYTLNGTVYNSLSSFLTASGGTFARNSIATYYDSTGTLQTASNNTPRFDYDPVTHAAKGILIEENRSNKLFYSSDIGNPWWKKLFINTTDDATTAPDGTGTADLCIGTGGGTNMIYRTNVAVNAGTLYTFSVYVKRFDSTSARIKILEGNTGKVSLGSYTFNMLTNTTSATQDLISYGFSAAGNGWYRIYGTFNSGSYTSVILYIFPNDINDVTGAYLWGVQLEEGAFPTSHIPTTTAAVTRNADNMSMPTGPWFHSTNGTLFSQVSTSTQKSPLFRRTVSINSGSVSDSISLILTDPTDGSAKLAEIHSGGINQFLSKTSTYSINTDIKQALLYDTNYALSASDGLLGIIDTTVGLPSVTTLNIGNHSNTTPRYLNGTVAKIKYYPLRISDTQLQLLTQ